MGNPAKKDDRRSKMTTRGASAKATATTAAASATATTAAASTTPTRPSSLDRRKGRKQKKTTTPIWIQYYNRMSQERGSPVNRGWLLPVSHFEELMDQVAGDEDALYETLKQHPEVGAFLYADGSGMMRIIHHLSPVVHGKSLVVGLEDFGGTSGEVKVINCGLFIAEIRLDKKIGNMEVPPISDFVKSDLGDIQAANSNPDDEAREVLTLSQIFDGQPMAYFLHPKWLPQIHPFVHQAPSKMAESIVQQARNDLNKGEDYEGEDLLDRLDECYALLVYLWACQNQWIQVDGSPKTYTLDNSNFETIQNSIIEKVSNMNRTTQELRFTRETIAEAPMPSFGLPPPPIGRGVGTGGRDSPSIDKSEEDESRGRKRSPSPRRKRPRSRSRSLTRSPSRSRSRSARDRRHRSRTRERSPGRSRSRSRRRRDVRSRSRSPPRTYRRSGDFDRKRKTLADKLTEEQLRAFTLMSARDWNDRRPELTRQMERLLERELVVRGFLTAICTAAWSTTGRITGTRKKPVGGKTVRTAASNLAEAFRHRLKPSPLHLPNSNVFRPAIRDLLKAFDNVTPPPQCQKAITPFFLRKLYSFARRKRTSVHAHAADIIIGAYFFACRSCEYVLTPAPGVTKRIQVAHIEFRDRRNAIIEHDDLLLLTRAEFVTICFHNQKNRLQMERRSHSRSGDPILCPVIRLATAIQRIRRLVPQASATTDLCTTIDGALRPITIDNTFTLTLLRQTCQAYGGTTYFNFAPNEIGNKSLRSGAAMALFLTNTTPDRIMIMGRWKSLAFLAYIRPQVLEWSFHLSATMINFNHFTDLADSNPSSRPHNNGRPIKIESFNVNFDRIN